VGGWYKDLRKERPPFAPPIHPDSSLDASRKPTAFTGLFGSYDSHRSCFPRSLAIPPNQPLGMTETMDSQRTTSIAYTRVSSLPIVAPRRKLSRNDSRGSILVIGDRRSRWCLHSAFVVRSTFGAHRDQSPTFAASPIAPRGSRRPNIQRTSSPADYKYYKSALHGVGRSAEPKRRRVPYPFPFSALRTISRAGFTLRRLVGSPGDPFPPPDHDE